MAISTTIIDEFMKYQIIYVSLAYGKENIKNSNHRSFSNFTQTMYSNSARRQDAASIKTNGLGKQRASIPYELREKMKSYLRSIPKEKIINLFKNPVVKYAA